jgi:hypothetical protein
MIGCDDGEFEDSLLEELDSYKVVLLQEIGEVAVIGIHPNPTRAALLHYLVLPWPRRTNDRVEVE